METIYRKLIDTAKGNNIYAIREVLDRVLGKPTQAGVVQGRGLFSSEQQRLLLTEIIAHANAT